MSHKFTAHYLPESCASGRERRTQRCRFCPLTPSNCSLSSVSVAAVVAEAVDDNVHLSLKRWSASIAVAALEVVVPAGTAADVDVDVDAVACRCNYDNAHLRALLMMQCRSPAVPREWWWKIVGTRRASSLECQLPAWMRLWSLLKKWESIIK